MTALGEALNAVRDRSAITGAEVLALRKALYADGRVSAEEACALLNAHRLGARGACDLTWAGFFVEALADYFALDRETPDHDESYGPDWSRAVVNVARVFSPLPSHKTGSGRFAWSGGPKAAIREEECGALISAFRRQGGLVLDPVERALVARLFSRAIDIPDTLRAFAVEALTATVIADGRIEADEVALLRTVFQGPGGEGGVFVSRAEAEALFAMHEGTTERVWAWRDLLAQAVGMHVLAGDVSPEAVDAEEAGWLADKLGPSEGWGPEALAIIAFIKSESQEAHPQIQALFDAARTGSAA